MPRTPHASSDAAPMTDDSGNKVIEPPEAATASSSTAAADMAAVHATTRQRNWTSKSDTGMNNNSAATRFELVNEEEEEEPARRREGSKSADAAPISDDVPFADDESMPASTRRAPPPLAHYATAPANSITLLPPMGNSAAAPCQLSHNAGTEPVVKKPKKAVDDYYKKQNELLENFKSDNEQIQSFQRTRTRQRLQSSTSNEPQEEGLTVSKTSLFQEGSPKVERGIMASSGELQPLTLGEEEDEDDEISQNRPPLVTTYMPSGPTSERIDEKHREAQENNKKNLKAAGRFAAITLFVNITLMFAKATASWLSGSLSIISSLVDSAVDITSGLVIYVTSRAIKKRDPYLYPRGRTRLEPLALIIVSVVMGVASVQLIIQSIHAVVNDLNYRPDNCSAFRPHKQPKEIFDYCSGIDRLIAPRVDAVSIGIMVATVVVKFTLVLICRRFKDDPSISVLAQDHRNDCISNLVALACAWLATEFWIYLDPIGAVLVSIYIACTWCRTGMEHVVMLSGKSAGPEFINRIIKVCIDHDPRIQYIDTVYVYHFGTRFLVEVHIVLDENMLLKTAHDISESLQINIESLPEVERAFVHTDYEFEHQPEDEHKVV